MGIMVGAAGVSYASVPDSSGVIHACYSTGALARFRIIDTATTPTCPANQTALTWNQQGVRGPAGPQGPAGPAGSSSGNTNARYLQLNWGDIPAGGTPQHLYTIPGFGDVTITKCDAQGATDYAFTNTSGQTISYYDNADGVIASILPGATISYGDGNNFPNTGMSIGNGSTSRVASIVVGPTVIPNQSLYIFYGSQF